MDKALFVVVKNHEDQYSIWSADRAVPAGWTVQGDPRPKEDCLEYINIVWTDMAPASLRKATAA
jgi:MbtH protein